MKLTFEEYQLILRQDFMSYIERSFYELNPQTELKVAQYIEVMASKLEASRQGKIRRLIINLPPRHLKSHCVSVAFISWLLGHDPSLQVISACYGQDLAEKFARDCRTLMTSALYKRLFPTRLSDRQAVHDFATTDGGTRMATSVGGVLTGRGADFIVIDDPMKPDEAMSETSRKAVNDWYDNTLLSRLNDKSKGCIIIVMQRLHQDDLVGHVLDQEYWEVVSFPAIAEEEESFVIESPLGRSLYHRQVGDLLDPARESLVTLENIRRTTGTYNFSSQYQQCPIPVGGNMVRTEWLQYYEKPPERFTYKLLSLDTANKAQEINDYSVGTVWGYKDNKFYLLHVFRKRLNYPDLKRAVLQLAKEYSVNEVLIEDRASGTQLLQDLRADGCYRLTPYLPIAGMDKIMRLNAQTPAFEQGLVYLPISAPWLYEYVKELTGFPGSKYDDQVNSTAQALHHMRSQSQIMVWRKLGENKNAFSIGLLPPMRRY